MLLMNARGAPLESVLPAATWPFSIDWLAPEADGLVDLFMQTPAGMMNLVSGEVGVRSGSADPGIIFPSGGIAAYFDGDGDQYAFSEVSGMDSTLPFSLVWEAWPSGVIDLHPAVATFKSVGSNAVRLSYSSTVGDLFLSETTTTMCRFAFSPWASLYDEYHRGVVTYDGSQYLLYINGGKVSPSGSATTAVLTNVTRIGRTNASDHDWAGAIRQVRRYTRAWSDEEAYAFCNRTGDALVRTDGRVRFAISRAVSITGSGSGLASGSASLDAAYSLVAAGVSVAGGTANLTASVPLSAAGASISSGSAGATALVSISAAGLAEAAGQAGLSLGALLFVFGYAQASGNAHISVRDNHIYPDRVTTIRIRGDSNLFVRA